jgi:hypothetical protein
MTRNRFDETWHRLRDWTKGQTASERLAAQILQYEGFSGVDPSHPLGGRDGGKDAVATHDGIKYVMAVYFPRGIQTFKNIKAKFENDLASVAHAGARGFAFVTNQELTLSNRAKLIALAKNAKVQLFHLERITAILDAPKMANIREQFLDIEADRKPSVSLGGLGGSAPGAGGGGGAAIGAAATGGDGGPGGDIFDLSGRPGTAPGSGGGGAGAVGDGAVGGEGGGGGEIISETFGPDDLEGIHHFDIQVGKGGVGGPGEDTIVNFCAEDGRVLRQIKAKGGPSAAPPYVPPISHKLSAADLDAGLRVTGMLAAEYVRQRQGLWTIVEGGWDWVTTSVSPFRIPLPLFIEVQTGTLVAGTVLDLEMRILNPDGFLTEQRSCLVVVEGGLTRRSRVTSLVELVGTKAGLWRVQIIAAETVISDLAIEVRMSEQNKPTDGST